MSAATSPLRALPGASASPPTGAGVAGELFPEPLWRELEATLAALDHDQLLWLSGYLAARSAHTSPPAAALASPLQPVPVAAAPAGAASKVLVAFGTETGNSRMLARKLAELAAERGMAVEIADLSNTKLRQLARRDHLLLICSTHGDGDPPEPIHDFYNALMDASAPRLEQLLYSVLALGDSSYEQFCVTGRQLDERLAELGAQRLAPREECDVDFEAPAAAWMERVLAILSDVVTTTSPASPVTGAAVPVPQAVATEYSKNQPLQTEVLENICLSVADDPSAVFHLELSLDVSDFPISPGDAVGVLVDNPPQLVAAILDATGLSGDEAVTVNDTALPLVQALREQCDLTIPSKRFLETWAEVSGSDAVRRVALADARAQREFLRQHQIRDLVAQYPARPEAQVLIDALRPLQPRLYDVANSLLQVSDELHLTVKCYHYPFGNRTESGIASSYLAQLQPGETLRLYPHRNARFHLPDDPATPLILIGEGTGIAPYRAFAQELSQRPEQPPCWLFFTSGQFEQDFLYQTEWQQMLHENRLYRIDTLFRQDHPEREPGDLFRGAQAELAAWLQRGAHIYFCGDKPLLSRAETALQQLLATTHGFDWKALDKAKRIHRNLY